MEFQETEWDENPDVFASKIRGIACRQLSTLMYRQGGHGHVPEHLEDTLQEVMYWFWKNNYHALRRWDPERGVPFECYVAMVVKHRALTLLRRTRPVGDRIGGLTRFNDLVGYESPDRHLESRDFTRKILEHLKHRLTTKGYEIFHSLFVEELSIEEAETCLGLSRAALYQWRVRLRRELQHMVVEL